MNSDATVAVENTEQEDQIAKFQSFDTVHTTYIVYEIKIDFND